MIKSVRERREGGAQEEGAAGSGALIKFNFGLCDAGGPAGRTPGALFLGA